jgi:hypothetical protein
MTMGRVLMGAGVLAVLLAGAPSAARAQGVSLFAILNGGNEVSASGDAAAGDPNGFGSALVMIRNSTTLCYAIAVTAIDTPTAAHIHEATAGLIGPIVVPLDPPAAGNPGTSSDCVPGLDSALVQRMRTNPSRFYINVHTGDFASGALRGQLF